MSLSTKLPTPSKLTVPEAMTFVQELGICIKTFKTQNLHNPLDNGLNKNCIQPV